MRLFLGLLLAFVAALTAAEWSRLNTLKPGSEVRVETARTVQTGRLVAVSDDAVRFTSDGAGEVALARAEVTRVYARGKSNRVRNAIIGTAVGVGIGAVMYGTLGTWFRNEGDGDTAYMLAVPIAVGAGVGAALPTGTMKKIYDSRD
jgi:hypothetical protein